MCAGAISFNIFRQEPIYQDGAWATEDPVTDEERREAGQAQEGRRQQQGGQHEGDKFLMPLETRRIKT